MTCPRCSSGNVTVQTITEVNEVKHKKGCAYWLFIGWWWEIIQWIFLGIIKLLMVCFKKRTRIVSDTKTFAVCQNCGNRWRV